MNAKIKKIIALALVILILFSACPHPAKAVGLWGESLYVAMGLKEMLEETFKKMQDTIVATLKMNAIRTVQSRMMTMMGGAGGGGQPQVVTNWRDTIYGSANKEAGLVVKDYFSSTKSGSGPGGQKIVSAGEKMYNADPTAMKPTIDQYIREGRVDKIFDKNYTPNPAQALNDLSKMRNYPAFYAMNAQGLYAVNYSEKAGAEAAKNIAYGGYKGTEAKSKDPNDKSGGAKEEQITMPGSTKRDIVSEIANMPNKMVTLARSIPEIVAALITQMLTQMINQGFSMMNSQINNVMRGSGASIPQMQGLIQQGAR